MINNCSCQWSYESEIRDELGKMKQLDQLEPLGICA